MLHETFINDLVRIQASGIRRFDDNDTDVLFRELKHIPEDMWKTMVKSYLDLDHHERNFTGYFLRSFRDMEGNRMKNPVWSAPSGSDYPTHVQATLFGKCTVSAMAIYPTQQSYMDWAHWFNKNWNELIGQGLTDFLSGELNRLKSTN